MEDGNQSIDILDSSSDEEIVNIPKTQYDKTQFDPPVFEKLPEIDEADKESSDNEINNTEFVYTSNEFVREEMEKLQLEKKNRQIEYEVEKIIDKREKMGVIEYLIKWKEYSEEHNSWEPESLLSCKELLEEFETKWNIEFNEFLSKIDQTKKPRGRKHKKLKPDVDQNQS